MSADNIESKYIWKVQSIELKSFFEPYIRKLYSPMDDISNVDPKEEIWINLHLYQNVKKNQKSLSAFKVKKLTELRLHIKDMISKEYAVQALLLPLNIQSVIVPNKFYVKVKEIIEKYNLEPLHDILFEMLAITQYVFIEWTHEELDNRSKNPQVKAIKKATEDLQLAIEQTILFPDSKFKRKKHLNPELQDVKFNFSTGPITIKNSEVQMEIIIAIIEHFKKYSKKGWRKGLENYADSFKRIVSLSDFQKFISYFFFLVLRDSNLFEFSDGVKYPSNVRKCILEIFEVLEINLEIEDYEDPDSLIKIRNWINRYNPKHPKLP